MANQNNNINSQCISHDGAISPKVYMQEECMPTFPYRHIKKNNYSSTINNPKLCMSKSNFKKPKTKDYLKGSHIF